MTKIGDNMEKRIRYYIHLPTGALRNEAVMYRHNREHKSNKDEYEYCCTARNYDEALAKLRGAVNPNTLYEYEDAHGNLRYATIDKLPSDSAAVKFGVFDIESGDYSLCQLIDLDVRCYDEE